MFKAGSNRFVTVAALAAVLGGTATTASAASTDMVGWLLANKPNATHAYFPAAATSFNSAGAQNVVTPISAGYYEINFRGLYNGGKNNNQQVSAIGTSGYCMSSGWDTEGDHHGAQMWVRCVDRHGHPANAKFTVLYQSRKTPIGDSSHGIAFLWADGPTSSSYTPSIDYNYNSTGALNTITRTDTGVYVVHMPGLTGTGGDVQVTAYDSLGNNPSRCNVGPNRWTPPGGLGETTADIRCFDKTGAPADEYFSFAYTVNMPFSQINGGSTVGGYAWADKPKKTSLYTPSAPWNFNSAGSDLMQAQNLGRGLYQVNVPADLQNVPSLVLMTAVQSTGFAPTAYCNIDTWFPVTAKCYKQGGVLVDSQFDVAVDAGPGTGALKRPH